MGRLEHNKIPPREARSDRQSFLIRLIASAFDAIVLFAGKDFSKWKSNKDGQVLWQLEFHGNHPQERPIKTAEEFGDFQMHLEFATPSRVEGTDQGRGDNGVNIYGRSRVPLRFDPSQV